MVSPGEFTQERLELGRVVDSGIFNRAPNLALLLNYVCSKYFERQAGQIKEYNIAVEALGRPEAFDPRSDSIVRVEAHRLRKRLKDYYATDGAAHPVHIEIPPGQYAPRFLIRSATPAETPGGADLVPSTGDPAPFTAAEEVLPEKTPELPVLVAPPIQEPAGGGRKFWIAAAVLLLAGAAFPIARLSHHPPRRLAPEPAAVMAGDVIRIACGLETGNYIDGFGNTWESDRFFEGGMAVHDSRHPIRGTRDQRLYNNRREGVFRYDIPLKPGVYELRLHFAETVYGQNNPAGGGESSRVFAISINGRTVLPAFDVIADREAGTADIRAFKDIAPAADGRLHLGFSAVSNAPILSGIEITPGVSGKMRPIRMVARDNGYRDKQGQYWEPDRYAEGGQLVARNDAVTGGPDPDLFVSERFGKISYVVPVAEGRYRVRLYFSEHWFGPGKTGGGAGAGERVFDILCNGVAVRKDFDIFKEAGGADKAVIVEIPDITPDHQGKIVISLLPAQNYACINAVEILDESQ